MLRVTCHITCHFDSDTVFGLMQKLFNKRTTTIKILEKQLKGIKGG